MKTLITATAITLASSAAFAGPYAGVEYNSTEVGIGGVGSATVGGPRVYVGAETEGEHGRLYGEVGYYDYDFVADTDWEIGGELYVTDHTTVYGSYGSTDIGFLDVNQAQVGIRFNF